MDDERFRIESAKIFRRVEQSRSTYGVEAKGELLVVASDFL